MKDLIVQLFSILVPLLLYQMVWEGQGKPESDRRRKMVIGLAGSLSIWMCMSFPSTLTDVCWYDMRHVPLLIGLLYGGWGVGLFLFAVMLGLQWLAGGDGLLLTLASDALFLAMAFRPLHRFAGYSHNRRIRIAALLGLLLSLLIIVVPLSYSSLVQGSATGRGHLAFFLAFAAWSAAGTGMAVFLIEKSRERATVARNLQESEKLQVVSHLAASVAHEVRNPLTVIRGFIQLLGKGDIELSKRETYVEMMLHELDRAQAIITDYLSYARPEPDPSAAEKVNVAHAIRRSVNIMSTYALAQAVAIETVIHDNLFVRAEPGKLGQVLVNLIKNAIEAMPEGGVIAVRGERRREYVAIEVADQGVGMTAEQVKRLGHPFFTTKEAGTGLGLMLSYRIVQGLNGMIRVDSAVGKGTRFTVLIPAAGGF